MKLWQVIKGIFAALIGIQSKDNFHEDFSQKNAAPYIILGVVFTILFVLSLIKIVTLIVKVAA